MYWSTGVPVYRCIGVPLYWCTGVPVYRCTDELVYRCIGVPVYRCIGVQARLSFWPSTRALACAIAHVHACAVHMCTRRSAHIMHTYFKAIPTFAHRLMSFFVRRHRLKATSGIALRQLNVIMNHVDGPRGSKMGPRWPQDGPKRPQEAPR